MARRALLIAAVIVAATACTNTAEPTTTTTTPPSTTTSTVAEPSTTSSSTTLASTTTTTVEQTTTTSTTPATTTTRAPTTTTTTIPIPEDNEPPAVEIVSPEHLSSHTAAYDAALKDFGAYITLRAEASDPNGDPVTVTWFTTSDGAVGTGEELTVWISTLGSDASQPVISARATDVWGAETADSVQIIVWIPSDT